MKSYKKSYEILEQYLELTNESCLKNVLLIKSWKNVPLIKSWKNVLTIKSYKSS